MSRPAEEVVDRAAYTAAGVDVAAGERAVELMRSRLRQAVPGVDVLAGLGGFGSAVALPAGMREPVLVSSTDGVGTKTAIAASLGRYDTIGQDLVAMCADDVACSGARPLFFLDYVAVGRLDPVQVAELVGGVDRGCELAGCALVGGETAEHPGVMAADQFDLAGFCVGVVERDELLDRSAVRAGDALIGISGNGLHANGYSLVRALVAEYEIDLERPYLEVLQTALGADDAERVSAEEPANAFATVGDVLLQPTRVYALDLLELRARLGGATGAVHGYAHITGGGLSGNVPRALPEHLAAHVRPDSWPVPSVFRLFAQLGTLDGRELRATLNCGIGMVAVVARDRADEAVAALATLGLVAWHVGEVAAVGAGGERYVEVA
jgi:phosphoribosylformylglycinamidine cyclo-ligase